MRQRLERLTWLMASGGVPDYMRSDNGSEFTATAERDWLSRVGVKTLFIERVSPWENGYNESFNGNLRAARRSFLVNMCADVSVMLPLGLVGLALLGFYMAQPQLVASYGGLVANADEMFPLYIANHLPVGISGLVVVALFAAAMSSVDSGSMQLRLLC